jgi:hypothetical protein
MALDNFKVEVTNLQVLAKTLLHLRSENGLHPVFVQRIFDGVQHLIALASVRPRCHDHVVVPGDL